MWKSGSTYSLRVTHKIPRSNVQSLQWGDLSTVKTDAYQCLAIICTTFWCLACLGQLANWCAVSRRPVWLLLVKRVGGQRLINRLSQNAGYSAENSQRFGSGFHCRTGSDSLLASLSRVSIRHCLTSSKCGTSQKDKVQEKDSSKRFEEVWA